MADGEKHVGTSYTTQLFENWYKLKNKLFYEQYWNITKVFLKKCVAGLCNVKVRKNSGLISGVEIIQNVACVKVWTQLTPHVNILFFLY